MALQSLYNQVRVRCISREDEKLMSAVEKIMLSSNNKSRSAMVRRDTRFTDLVHCIMKYTLKFELEYEVLFFQDRASDIAVDVRSFLFFQNASLSMCSRYTYVANLSFKKNKVFIFATERSK